MIHFDSDEYNFYKLIQVIYFYLNKRFIIKLNQNFYLIKS